MTDGQGPKHFKQQMTIPCCLVSNPALGLQNRLLPPQSGEASINQIITREGPRGKGLSHGDGGELMLKGIGSGRGACWEGREQKGT